MQLNLKVKCHHDVYPLIVHHRFFRKFKNLAIGRYDTSPPLKRKE